MKIKDLLSNKTITNILRYLLIILIFLAIFLPIYLSSNKSLTSLCNSFFIPGAVLIGIGFLSLLTYFGFFDFVGYGFTSVYQSLKKESIREYKDLIDYKEKKTLKRKDNKFIYIPYFIFGLIFLIVSLIIRAYIK